MTKWPTKDHQIATRFTTETFKALERIAKREKCSVSALVRQVVEEFVEKEKKRGGEA